MQIRDAMAAVGVDEVHEVWSDKGGSPLGGFFSVSVTCEGVESKLST